MFRKQDRDSCTCAKRHAFVCRSFEACKDVPAGEAEVIFGDRRAGVSRQLGLSWFF